MAVHKTNVNVNSSWSDWLQ